MATPDLSKFTDSLKQHKKLILIGLAVAGLGYGAYVAMSPAPAINAPREKSAQLATPNKDIIGVALDPKVPTASTGTTPAGALPAPTDPIAQPPGIIVETRNPAASGSAPPSPAQESAPSLPSASGVSERPLSALGRIQAFYDSAGAGATPLRAEGQLAQTRPKTSAAPATPTPGQIASIAPPTTAIAPVESKTSPELLRIATQLRVQLLNGMVTITGRDSQFTGVVGAVVGPGFQSQNYAGCFVYGTATLDAFTHRVNATVRSLSCPTKVFSIEAFARDSDTVEGLRGRYFERVTERVILSAVPSFGTEYMSRKTEALQDNNVTVVDGTAVATSQVANPEKYALYGGLNAGWQGIQSELQALRNRLVPVNIIDPGLMATFIVKSQATATHFGR